MTEEQRPIIILRMKGGLELVGELVGETETEVLMGTPLQTLYKNIPGLAYPLVTFKHFLLFAPDNTPVPFKKVDVATHVPARPTFAQFYRMQVKSDDLMQDVDRQFEQLTSHTSKQKHDLTDKEREELKHLSHKIQLEMFDVSKERQH